MIIYFDYNSKTETFTSKCEECEACESEYDLIPEEHDSLHKRCKECDDCKDKGNCSEVVYTGKIGNSFMDFISLDFDYIAKNIIDIIKKHYPKLSDIFKLYDSDMKMREKKTQELCKQEIFNYLYSQHFYFSFYGLPIDPLFDLYCLSLKSINNYNEIDELFRKKVINDYKCIQKVVNICADNLTWQNETPIINGLWNLGIISTPCEYKTYLNEIEFYSKYFKENKDDAPFSINYEPEDMINILNDISLVNISALKIREFHVYEMNELLGAMLNEILENYSINICKNCGKYFIPYNRSDTIYCDRSSPQDLTKTCKEYGSMVAYQNHLKTNEAMGLYRKIYMQKQMLAKRNPDIMEYQKDFEEYKIESKQWKADVKKGIKTEEEYLEWLKSVKAKKV